MTSNLTILASSMLDTFYIFSVNLRLTSLICEMLFWNSLHHSNRTVHFFLSNQDLGAGQRIFDSNGTHIPEGERIEHRAGSSRYRSWNTSYTVTSWRPGNTRNHVDGMFEGSSTMGWQERPSVSSPGEGETWLLCKHLEILFLFSIIALRYYLLCSISVW